MKNNLSLTQLRTNALQVLTTVVLLCCSTMAMAASDMFLVIPNVKGEAIDPKYNDAIVVLAWSWGTSAQIGNGKHIACNIQDLSVTKYVDSASPILLMDQLQGTTYPVAKLVVRKAGKDPLEYIVIEFFDVRVSSLSTGGSGGEDKLTENITLNFGSAIYTYTRQKDGGGKDDPVVAMINGC